MSHERDDSFSFHLGGSFEIFTFFFNKRIKVCGSQRIAPSQPNHRLPQRPEKYNFWPELQSSNQPKNQPKKSLIGSFDAWRRAYSVFLMFRMAVNPDLAASLSRYLNHFSMLA